MRFLIIFLTFVLCTFGEKKVFYYFGYGSNLLSKRIHIQNPSAVFVTPAVLYNHRLDFDGFTERWDGAPATVVADNGNKVWGAVWEIETDQMDNLDRQESVHTGLYKAKNVTVHSKDKEYTARVYVLSKEPARSPTLSHERRPSKSYMKVIIDGAIESGLPADYIEHLKNIPHNGKLASPEILSQLNQA